MNNNKKYIQILSHTTATAQHETIITAQEKKFNNANPQQNELNKIALSKYEYINKLFY